MAIFQRDYRRIAELHVEAGWMPADIRIDELEAACRSVCEPYFTRPLSEISLAEVMVKLFKTAQRYQLTLQPQLILLQKTLLNIEGVGRLLDPKIDIFNVAQPVLEGILRERYSPQALLGELRKRLPELITHAPEMPRLVREFLVQQVNGAHTINMRSAELAELARISRDGQRQTTWAILGAGLLVSAVVLHALDAAGPAIFGLSGAVWLACAGALGCFLAAWPRRR
jgi:ubiquinone biosynthesis protein